MSHIHELYDFTVSGFIIHDHKLLLLHHKKLGSWLQPGGHIELDEDPEQALWREIEEETGLKPANLKIVEPTSQRPYAPDAKNLPLPFDLNVHNFGDDSIHKHIDISYLITSDTDKIIHNPQESNDLRWFSLDDLRLMKNELLPDIYERAMFTLNVVF